jgi:tRNA A-37 threonylcarbamoyl transferase component Bud32
VAIRLLLDKILAPALAAAGLNSAAAIFRLGDPTADSLVAVVDVPVEGTVGRFHLKRYRYAGWGASKGLLGRGTLWGAPPEIREFKNLEFLREKGVPAVKPIAAASETRRGRLVAHALLTEHVPDSLDLARRLATPGDPVREVPAVRRRTAELIGRHVHRMHQEGFVHRDLFARNVIVRVEEDQPSVWLCDCRRGGPPSLTWKAFHDLATLDGDLKGAMPRTDRLRALSAYAGTDADLGAWVAKVAPLRDRLLRAKA